MSSSHSLLTVTAAQHQIDSVSNNTATSTRLLASSSRLVDTIMSNPRIIDTYDLTPNNAAPSSSHSHSRPSAISSAAALGIGPGMIGGRTSSTPSTAANGGTPLSGRILLQAQAVPMRRGKERQEEKSPGFGPERNRSRSPHTRASRNQTAASFSTTDAPTASSTSSSDDAPSKIAPLRLPILRSVFAQPGDAAKARGGLGSAAAGSDDLGGLGSAPADEQNEGTTIVGGADADFENYERSLGLHSGEDAIEFFARNGNNTPVKFVYCNRSNTGDVYRPYDLVVVSRKKVCQDEYFTISTTGVVHVHSPSPSEFMSLAQWMHESAMFNMLRCIRFFKHYLHAKMFRLWRSNVRYRIYCKQRKQLSKKLFLARESFVGPLLEVNKIMSEFDVIPLNNVKSGVYQSENFVKDQIDARTLASKKFEEKFERLADQIERVCKGVKDRARQYDHRIANDDLSNSRFAQHLLGGNGRIKSMVSIKKERSDRLRQLKHANLEADMLGDFIRLIDYIQVEHLVNRSVSTTVQFLYLLLNSNKALFQTTVSFAKEAPPQRVGANGQLIRGHGHGARNATASHITHSLLSGNANGLNFSPTSREIHNIITNMNENCITTVDTVDRILHHPKFKPFISPLLVDSPKISKIIHTNRTYLLSKTSISDKIESDFTTVEQTISFLEKHRPVYEFGESWNLDTYCNTKEHSVDTIQKDMLQQTDWNVNIRKVRDLYDSGIFEANTKDLKNKLTPITEVALAGMKDLLLKIFHTKCVELQEAYTTRMKQLDEDPTTLPSFAAHVELFTQIKVEGRQLYERSKKIENMHRLMYEYDMLSMIPPQDEVAFDDLLSSVKAFDNSILQTDSRIEEKMPSMKQTVYKNIARLNNELESTKQALDEGIYVDEKANPKDVLKELDRIKQILSDIKSQTQTLQEYQVLFEKNEPYHFNTLPTTIALYEKKRAFWELYQSWLEKSKKWNQDDFQTLNVEEIEREVSETYATIVKMNKESKSDQAVTLRVKNMIQEFKSLMPLILELGNKAIKQTHWRQIFTNLGASWFPQTEKIRLKNLRKMNIFAHKQLINDICEQAVGEYALQTSLTKIQKIWITQEFILQPYQKSKDIYLLGDVEDILMKLEENQSTLQVMLASPYISAVQQEVDLWDKKLSFLSEVMEEWLVCQRQWSYLSPIFSSQDIQRQLPLESKMFQDVDRFWKEIMRRVSNNLNVMSMTQQPQILAQFIKANKELDRIEKHLEEYLETKRASFPRFYFLSNNELLEILSKSKEPQTVQPHLVKCFDHISSLQFTSQHNSIEVIGMIGQDSEYVPFQRSIYTRGNTETWLAEVEDVMRLTVRTMIKKALAGYAASTTGSSNDRTNWLTSFPSQAILIVDQIMWTSGVTNALRMIEQQGQQQQQGGASLDSFLQTCHQQISSMVEMVQQQQQQQSSSSSSASNSATAATILRSLLSSLIIQSVHGRDVVASLLSSNIRTQNDFEWQKQLRYYWANTLDQELQDEMALMNGGNPEKMSELPMEGEDYILRQTHTSFISRYEYTNSSRLVITPLTDRAYLTLTSALHSHYGGAPQGPAGTGKTETVKDLAKILAIQTIVFNCSEGLTAKMMGQYFSGLAQSGAWACFDEFNRIDIEVLSVIAQQITTIQTAVSSQKTQFDFEGRLLPLDSNFGVFITMNPGYAGRTELPSNLKALFRPVAMMVPDYGLIAQIILFSEGFQSATVLSKKMVQLYKLASEQLSQQQHYDFGMRAVKSVLVAAGALKRAAGTSGTSSSSESSETLLLINAMLTSNVPKFLSADIPLFLRIITDLFPSVQVPTSESGLVAGAVERTLQARNLQAVPEFRAKILQFYETLKVRHGVMLVGATMSGKSTAINTLAEALTSLKNDPTALASPQQYSFLREIHQHVLNPKAVGMDALYGASNAVGEWQDGLVPWLVRRAVTTGGASGAAGESGNESSTTATTSSTDSTTASSSSRKWIQFDGPVDALWIENMNSSLDDNKILCLNNGERIKLRDTLSLIFETEDLSAASPATVSRCGMIYLEPSCVGWVAIIDSWRPSLEALVPERTEFIVGVMKQYFPAILTYVREDCKQMLYASETNLVKSCCQLLLTLIKNTKHYSDSDSEGGISDDDMPMCLNSLLWSAIVWSIGANLYDSSRTGFSHFLRAQLQVTLVSSLPIDGLIYDYTFDISSLKWVTWESRVPEFVYDAQESFCNILVPTAETVKYAYYLDMLLSSSSTQQMNAGAPAGAVTTGSESTALIHGSGSSTSRNILMCGETGVGKSVIIQEYLRNGMMNMMNHNASAAGGNADSSSSLTRKSSTSSSFVSISLMFSAQTSSQNLQDSLETKLERKRKNLLGAPVGKKCVVFIDDVNMPTRETYGASPPLELLRQTIDSGGFYNVKNGKLFFTRVQDTVFITACAPPGGGRNIMSQRLTRHFHHLYQPSLQDASLRKIFTSILSGFLSQQASHWMTLSSTGQPTQMNLHGISTTIIDTSLEVYNSLRKYMLPTPAKSHYTYNLRDFSKVIQGICQVTRKNLPDLISLLRLWLHESSRIFRDRLVDESDRSWFNRLCAAKLNHNFETSWEVEDFAEIIYSDLVETNAASGGAGGANGAGTVSSTTGLIGGSDPNDYRELSSIDKLSKLLDEQLCEYNLMFSNNMSLVFFTSAIQHLTRISRILRQPRGNALLIGVGGSGRQSLTRLASFIAGYKTVTIEMTREFTQTEWREQIKKIVEQAGCENKPVTFLLNDSTITQESFLEDINSLLNSGEILLLYEYDELEAILQRVRPLAKAAGRGLNEGRDSLYQYFIQLVRENLHIVLCCSPIGDSFRTRCRQYPSLINCSTIDYFSPWTEDALYSVADRFLSDKSLGLESAQRQDLCKICVKIHTSVTDSTVKYWKEMRRYNYVTPTSYLELLKLYIHMLLEQRDTLTKKIMKYRTGLNKLQSTQKMVEDLKVDLVKLQPILRESSEEVVLLLVELEKDQAEASATASICQIDAEQCAETTRHVLQIKDECQADLDEAMPAFEAATKQLDTLDRNDITILKSFQNPPQPVKKTMEAVCILMNQPVNWESAKRLVSRTDFLQQCKSLDKDHIPKKTIKALQKYLEDREFTSEALANVSTAAVSLCMWVRAMDVYSRVMRAVLPKREALEAAESSLRHAQETLAAKQLSLKVVEARVAGLHAKYRMKQSEKDELEQNIERTKLRLIRAEKLVSGLSSEEVRWQQEAENLNGNLKNLIGNIILSAGSIAYLGPFTSSYRNDLTRVWNTECLRNNIPIDQSFSLIKTLSDPLLLRKWQIQGLPHDEYSTQNALLTFHSKKWPLLIDPQGQGNRWIKNLGRRENLQCIKLTEPSYLKVLENAIRYGQPVLLENVMETSTSGQPGIDPLLDPLLTKAIFKKGGQWLLRLNEIDIPFSSDFRFYITTSLSNPHYLPDIFVKLTLINFTVTLQGLTEQLLIVVCGLERSDLETKNDRLIVQINDDRIELATIEDRILELLNTSSGNILDDEIIINTLAASKTTSINVTERMLDAEETVRTINTVREEYRPIAERASILFFTISDLCKIDTMYNYSLTSVMKLFSDVVRTAEKPSPQLMKEDGVTPDLTQRITILLSDLNSTIYTHLCRGLFEKDKMLFAFQMAVNIEKGKGKIEEKEYLMMLRGAVGSGSGDKKDTPSSPTSSSSSTTGPSWLAKDQWDSLCAASQSIPIFARIVEDLRSSGADGESAKSRAWQTWCQDSFTSDTPSGSVLPSPYDHSCTPFQQLLLTRFFRRDRFVHGVKSFIASTLGQQFVKTHITDVKSMFATQTNNRTPILFILSADANPMQYITRLAKERNIDETHVKMLSLGQGQSKTAEDLITQGKKEGDWIILQNLHLSEKSFLPILDRIISETQQGGEEIHDDYRLILTSMPLPSFPVNILQNSLKLTMESPKGLANQLMTTFNDMAEDEYESILPQGSNTHPQIKSSYKKLLFGLAYFHGILQERYTRFGSIGFNAQYDFMSSDFEISKKQLRMYLDEVLVLPNSDASSQLDIPWQTLTEIIGEINYGGRVTDQWDQRCVRSLLQRYLTPFLLNDDYNFDTHGVYFAPKGTGRLQTVKDYITTLPTDSSPDAFGLHENADITFQLSQANKLLETCIMLQPRVSGGGTSSSSGATAEKTPDQIVVDILLSLDSRLPALLDKKTAHPSTFADLTGHNTLGIFLTQEIDRFNTLLTVIKTTIVELQRAIKGVVIMSQEYEMMYKALSYNQVPSQWSKTAYPSLASLTVWYDDLIARCTFLRSWILNGEPTVFWFSSFFFPQGFLTAVLQRYARQTKIPIDSLTFTSHVTKYSESSDVTSSPVTGVYLNGLFLQGAAFDQEQGCMTESTPGVLFTKMPILHLQPVQQSAATAGSVDSLSYECPIYKTSARAGVLSTTGHSTNFVISTRLPTAANPDHWIRRGAAILLQLDQ